VLKAFECLTETYLQGRLESNLPESLEAGLADALLDYPSIALDPDQRGLPEPMSKSWPDVLQQLSVAPVSSDVEACLQAWLERSDFRWVDRLLQRVEDPDRRAVLVTSVDAARKRAADRLLHDARQAEERIEQAVLEGSIDPNDRAKLAGQLEETRHVANRRDADFVAAEAVLRDVSLELDEKREAVVATRRTRVDSIKPLLEPFLISRAEPEENVP
jgi:hypothetical protein